MDQRMIDIVKGVENCVRGLANVQKDENVLILTDTSIDSVFAQTFATVINGIGARPAILTITAEMAEASEVGGDVPRHIVSAVSGADTVIGVTSYPMQHTPAIRPLVTSSWRDSAGTLRWINVPPPHFLTLTCEGATKVPGPLVAKITKRVIERMQKGRTFRMVTGDGAEIACVQEPSTLNIEPKLKWPLPKGRFNVFPTCAVNPKGELHAEGDGVMVVDAVDCFLGKLGTPIRYTIEKGYVTKVEGGPEADWIRNKIAELGVDRAGVWWEFSIGTNPCIPVYRNNFGALQVYWHALAHRAAGVVHIAIGQEPYFHLHGTILEPTVTCLETQEVIIEKGYLKALDDADIREEMEALGIKPSRW